MVLHLALPAVPHQRAGRQLDVRDRRAGLVRDPQPGGIAVCRQVADLEPGLRDDHAHRAGDQRAGEERQGAPGVGPFLLVGRGLRQDEPVLPVTPEEVCCGGQCCFRWWWAATLLSGLAVLRIQTLKYPRKPLATKGILATGTYRVARARARQPALAAWMSLRMASSCRKVLVSSSAIIE